MKELEEKELRHSGENWYIERSRLKDIIEEKNQQYLEFLLTVDFAE